MVTVRAQFCDSGHKIGHASLHRPPLAPGGRNNGLADRLTHPTHSTKKLLQKSGCGDS